MGQNARPQGVDVKTKAGLFAAVTVGLLMTSLAARSAVLTFDDVAGSVGDSYGAMPTYQGFTFGALDAGLNRLDWIDTVGSGWNYGAVSGEFTLLNNHGGIGVIRAANGSDFSFDGLWAETWAFAPARTGYIRGFNNGTQIWTSAITLNSQFQYFGGIAGSIDELRLDFGNFFLVDNLALNEPRVPTVPEPATLGLLGLGLVGLGFARRRRARD
jgi:hypothetical protein